MGLDIKRMDIYRKVPKDLTQPTPTGAVISICCVVFMLFMLGTELVWFISPDIRSELVVMNSDPTERIPVKINISIPRMKCEFLGIDIQVQIHIQCVPKTMLYHSIGFLYYVLIGIGTESVFCTVPIPSCSVFVLIVI